MMATPFRLISKSESDRTKAARSGGCKCASGSSIRTSVFSSTTSTSLVIVRRTILWPELRFLNNDRALASSVVFAVRLASVATSASLNIGSASSISSAWCQRLVRRPSRQAFTLCTNSPASRLWRLRSDLLRHRVESPETYVVIADRVFFRLFFLAAVRSRRMH